VLPAKGSQHHLVYGSDTYPARVGDRPLRNSPQVEEGGVVPAADLVLEGGGLKGLGGAGAVLGLMAQGYTFPRVAGTSAGAIVGAFVAAGASPTRLEQLMSELDYRKVPDRSGFKLPLLSEGLSLFLDGGAYEGDYIHNWLCTELKALGVETFGQLRRADPDDDVNLPVHQRYKLVVTATDVTRGRLLRLPWDYEQFGLDPDTQLVADAVRASMSIPLYFEPQQLRNPQTGETSTIVDGGVLTNFPVEIFDRTGFTSRLADPEAAAPGGAGDHHGHRRPRSDLCGPSVRAQAHHHGGHFTSGRGRIRGQCHPTRAGQRQRTSGGGGVFVELGLGRLPGGLPRWIAVVSGSSRAALRVVSARQVSLSGGTAVSMAAICWLTPAAGVQQ